MREYCKAKKSRFEKIKYANTCVITFTSKNELVGCEIRNINKLFTKSNE